MASTNAGAQTQGLANIVWALSQLGLHPTPAWLYSYVTAVRRQLAAGALRAVDLGQVIHAMRDLNTTMQLTKVRLREGRGTRMS